jgi:hypothetical protein
MQLRGLPFGRFSKAGHLRETRLHHNLSKTNLEFFEVERDHTPADTDPDFCLVNILCYKFLKSRQRSGH